jgi:hypothetical protein
MASNRIWIPSIQKYKRMKEIDCEQYRDILKSIDDDTDFELTLNEVINYNLLDKSIFSTITLIDKFVILLQLKVVSCGPILKLTRVCEKCESKTNFSIDLNKMLDDLSEKIDQSFSTTFHNASISVTCDIPSLLLDETINVEETDYNKKLDLYLYSFIKNIKVGNSEINLDEISLSDKIAICESLPFSLLLDIKNNFIDVLHKIFKNLLLLKTKCSNDKCEDSLELKMDFNNLTDLSKILFRDSSLANILGQYANISMNCHFDYNFYKNLSPGELDIVTNMLKSSEKDNTKSSKDINLFEEYNVNAAGMVESPSEFL